MSTNRRKLVDRLPAGTVSRTIDRSWPGNGYKSPEPPWKAIFGSGAGDEQKNRSALGAASSAMRLPRAPHTGTR